MAKTLFSDWLVKDISNARRIRHSFTQYISAGRSSRSVGDYLEVGGNAVGFVAGTAGGVVGIAVLAGAGFATVGVASVIAGPIVALAAAILGIALLIKSTYSNRESAHNALSPYVWNMVDDEKPKKGAAFSADGLADACDAAMTLLDDGKNQIKLLGSKLKAAETKFMALIRQIEGLISEIETHRVFLSLPPIRMATGSIPNPRVAAADKKITSLKAQVEKIFKMEFEQGGAIYEYVRRCSHTGNYVQAAHIVALAMREKIDPGSVINVVQPDFFLGVTVCTDSRAAFLKLDAALKQVGVTGL